MALQNRAKASFALNAGQDSHSKHEVHERALHDHKASLLGEMEKEVPRMIVKRRMPMEIDLGAATLLGASILALLGIAGLHKATKGVVKGRRGSFFSSKRQSILCE